MGYTDAPADKVTVRQDGTSAKQAGIIRVSGWVMRVLSAMAGDVA